MTTLRQRQTRDGEKAYMRSFRDTACESCGINDGTVVAAHCNMEQGGTGYRAPGVVAGLCHDCHAFCDGRVPGARVERQKVWIRVAQKLMSERFDAWKTP